MAFNISLLYNYSEKNKVDKTIESVQVLRGIMRAESSIVNPVILVESGLTLQRAKINYMKIENFGRYYFVTDIRIIRDRLFEISAHVDVLTSYAAQIRESSAIIRKQANQWNLYLNDGSFKVYQNPNVLTKAFPSGFSGQEFILAVAGS